MKKREFKGNARKKTGPKQGYGMESSSEFLISQEKLKDFHNTQNNEK